MSTMDEQTVERVEVDGGKYTVVMDMKNFRALRHGEGWQDLTGNNLVFHLAYELAEARAAIAAMPDTNTLADSIAELEAQVSKARENALQEASEVGEKAQRQNASVENAILALIDKEPTQEKAHD